MVIPPEVLLLLRIVFAILGFLLSQVNVQIALSISVKLRAPTVLPKVMSSNPSNHMMIHNHP